MFLTLTVLLLVCAWTQPAQEPVSASAPGNTPESKQIVVTNDDVKNVRRIIADKEFYKTRTETLESEKAEAELSADNWKSLYEREKYRADVVQENRINEVKKAYEASRTALDKSEAVAAQLRAQHAEDKDYIGRLEFRVNKLKSQRLTFGLTGAATGAGAGFAAGYYFGRQNSSTNINVGTGMGGLAGNRLASFRF